MITLTKGDTLCYLFALFSHLFNNKYFVILISILVLLNIVYLFIAYNIFKNKFISEYSKKDIFQHKLLAKYLLIILLSIYFIILLVYIIIKYCMKKQFPKETLQSLI